MKILDKKNTSTYNNSKSCIIKEYLLEDSLIDCSIISISGRYPESGYSMNLNSKGLFYVDKGSGVIVNENGDFSLSEGQIVIVNPKEKYAWLGDFTLISIFTPSWKKEQYRIVK